MVFNILEILDMVIMTAIVGYLFMDAFRVPLQQRTSDIIDEYKKLAKNRGFDWDSFWFACALIAPSLIVHELGHKFSALAFGLDATFVGACSSTAVFTGGFFNFTCVLQLFAVAMKLLGTGFLIFIPAFVSIQGGATPFQHFIISFAGPFVHLVFWLGAAWLLRDKTIIRTWPQKKRMFVFFFKQINMFLFFFNMLPIPPFDGWWVFSNLFKVISGMM